MDIQQQIESGQLVCPKTKQKLSIVDDGQWIENADKTERYRFLNGKVPILLADPRWMEEYAHDSENMNKEYTVESIDKRESLLGRIKSTLLQDYRTESSKKALSDLFLDQSNDALCISIGGGPTRAHPMLFNLNIGPFPNVEVVADAHCLPYADACVDLIYSEAVFEHLYNPVQAAKEIHRVLKRGRKAYICTPFMQPYRGYPHHYQNYTITGHQNLFESVGFRISEAGVCVGPVYTVLNVGSAFIHEYIPHPLKRPLKFFWGASGIVVRPMDKYLGKRKNAYVLASTTYAIVEKI